MNRIVKHITTIMPSLHAGARSVSSNAAQPFAAPVLVRASYALVLSNFKSDVYHAALTLEKWQARLS